MPPARFAPMPMILPLRSKMGQVQSDEAVPQPTTRTPLPSNRGASGPTRRAVAGAAEAEDAHRKPKDTAISYKEGYLLRTRGRQCRHRVTSAVVRDAEGSVGGASSSAGVGASSPPSFGGRTRRHERRASQRKRGTLLLVWLFVRGTVRRQLGQQHRVQRRRGPKQPHLQQCRWFRSSYVRSKNGSF